MDKNKKLYEKSKYIVKKWESEFKKVTSNLPTKADIRAAPSKIKEAYKIYWSLKNKTYIKSSTTCDISDENAKDCFNSSSENPEDANRTIDSKTVNILEDSICFQPLSETQSDSQFLCSLTSQDTSTAQDSLDISVSSIHKNNDDTPFKANEGFLNSFQNIFSKNSLEESTNDKKKEDKLKPEIKSISSKYAEKLFAGSKFKKRNPRKPRNFIRSKTTDCISEKPLSESPPNEGLISKTLSFSGGDDNCSQKSTFSSASEVPSFIDDCHDESALFLNDKFKIVNRDTSRQSLPVSLLQKTFDISSGKLSLNHTVDKGWLDRIEDCSSQKKPDSSQAESEDSGISSIKSDSSLTTPSSEIMMQKGLDSDEDLIYDSDCESQSQSFCRLNLLDSLNRSTSNLDRASSFIRNEASSNCFGVKPKESFVKEIPFPIENSTGTQINISTQNSRKRSLLDPLDSSKQSSKRQKTDTPSLQSLNEYNFTSSTKPELITPFQSSKKQTKKSPDPDSVLNSKDSKKMALLEKKMASGAANENFVKINIEKKRYVRGKKNVNFSKYKKQKWKELKKNSSFERGSGVLKCFKCGDVGHYSKACPNKVDGLTPLEDYDSSEESPFPTLEEAAEMAREAAEKAHRGGRKFTKADENGEVPEPENEDVSLRLGSLIKPLYDLNPDGSLIETPIEVYEALNELGHSSFRSGQEEGIMRILSGSSTLVTLSTGSGKSLIYQLPAYLYNKKNPGCLTLVISPLVSLMEDQVFCGSKKLRAACLHHNMTQKRREAVLESLKSQSISILLIAPESLSSWDSARSLFKILPPIAFVCIDEAHSISQFSHNFRPSYLTICQVLREKLGISTLLGLTATASRATLDTVMSQLGIEDNNSVITDTPLPDNLFLSVSSEENRREALISLIRSDRFKDYNSIIIYCTRREECDGIAGFLRVALQENNVPNKKGRLSLHAESYHAGLTAGRRNQVQSAFMTGKLRIVVATVAFGMGINKNDIRGIIHYNMPYSFESYVQEIGRAGRDRKPAHCHLFLDSQRNDLCELQRHIYADSMDRVVLRRLLQMVFVPCNCRKNLPSEETGMENGLLEVNSKECSHHEVAFPIESTIKSLDLPQEVISTLLAYLQLDKKKWIKVLPLAYTKCKITSYKGARNLMKVARSCPPLAVVMAENSEKETATVEFDIIELARKINWDSGTVKHTLKQLEWTTVDDKPRKTGIIVEFSCLGFRVLSPGDLDDSQLDEALDLLHGIVLDQEYSRLKQLKLFYDSLKGVSYQSVMECCDDVDMENSDNLKAIVRKFFTDKEPLDGVSLPHYVIKDEGDVASDIRRLISMYRDDATLHGRAIARILHGIGSPNFPPIVWGRTKFWRLHLDKDFNSLVKLSNKQIILMK